jgi:hypothetical protein
MSQGELIVLSAVYADDAALEVLRRMVQGPLGQEYRFVVLCAPACCETLSGLGADVEPAADRSAIRARLRVLKPTIVQSFSDADHRAIVYHLWRHPYYMLATHVRAEQAIPRGRINHLIYNRLTDLNIFLDAAAMANSGKPGYLHLNAPFLLEQASVEGDSVSRMLAHAYASLLHPVRHDIDDCPKADYSDLRLAYITHFYCNQNDISSVTRLLERYAAYPEDVRARVQFVIVDDGSPIEYQIPDLPLNLTWLRIDQDIRWNQAGARNLGAVYAHADTIMLTDLDHELPLESMRQLIARPSCGKRLYKMWRKDAHGRYEKGHPNLFVLSRGRFIECFGYDEEYAGHYGGEDYRFVKYQKARGSLQKYLPKRIWCIERQDIDRKRSYHSLVRDHSFNSPIDSRKRHELAHVGNGYGHSRTFLNFTWTVLLERQLNLAVKRPEDSCWKQRSLLRQVLPRF